MNSRMKIVYICELNKGFDLKFPQDYWLQQKLSEDTQNMQLVDIAPKRRTVVWDV